ncbi:hypothetical protein C8Q73DRAFT_55165 [Cubamyces lactineus]|nr:hypothetical protein C8Q73DRAFT_55165 [Cubamyces lactineus]
MTKAFLQGRRFLLLWPGYLCQHPCADRNGAGVCTQRVYSACVAVLEPVLRMPQPPPTASFNRRQYSTSLRWPTYNCPTIIVGCSTGSVPCTKSSAAQLHIKPHRHWFPWCAVVPFSFAFAELWS